MINLLPPQQKEELFQDRRYKLLLISGILAINFLIVLSLLLLSAEIFISGKAQGEKVVISPELLAFEKEIIETNKRLRSLDSFYSERPALGELLEKISQTLSSGVHLTSLSLNFSEKEKNFSASLQGFSPTRELLFQLKRNLESEPRFKDINFPTLNWAKPENIEFNVSFKAKI